jgi:hypothetical protein
MFALLAVLLIAGAYGQAPSINDTQEQKPTEEKQGGEYSGFEETERQTEGIPTKRPILLSRLQ